ncbi:MAG TPA: protein phosphatase 2C domain-containing protein [Blastocatellia bacterium]|nr:protein phosphatase 2C domain-containing protein [Blastocatellia bacterium]
MSLPKLTFGTVSDRGLNPRRTANEDRFLALPQAGLFLVADGVGGRRAGQVASQTVVDTFTETFAQPVQGKLMATIKQAIARCNQTIFAQSHELAELEGMATTLAMVAFEGSTDNGQAIIAHVGDSRVYRFDGTRLHLETADHSELGDAVRAGEMTYAQAAGAQQQNIINRALGVEDEVEADFKVVPINSRTRFLICSDGITRHISDTELESLMSANTHPERLCSQLKELCFARGAEDNLTAVVVDVGERRYVEALNASEIDEVTRPKVTSAIMSGKAAETSRFSVAVDENNQTSTKANQMSSRNPAPTRAKSSNKSSNLIGFIQLLLLLAAFVGVFFAGRYWDQLYAWVLGRTSNPTVTNQNGNAPSINPELAAAQALFEEKRYDKARDRFTEFVRQDPNNAEFRYWLGRAQYELKQSQEAVRNLSEAARLNERLPLVFVHLAIAQDAAGDRKGANESLRRAVSLTESASPAPTATSAQ